MLATYIIVSIIIGLLIAFAITNVVKMLDYGMDYGGYLWRIRYAAAVRYIDNAPDDIREGLIIKAAEATSQVNIDKYSDQQDTMNELYLEIAARQWRFGRWVCIKCMATFLAMWIAIIVCIVGLISWYISSCVCLFACSIIVAFVIVIMPFKWLSE